MCHIGDVITLFREDRREAMFEEEAASFSSGPGDRFTSESSESWSVGGCGGMLGGGVVGTVTTDLSDSEGNGVTTTTWGAGGGPGGKGGGNGPAIPTSSCFGGGIPGGTGGVVFDDDRGGGGPTPGGGVGGAGATTGGGFGATAAGGASGRGFPSGVFLLSMFDSKSDDDDGGFFVGVNNENILLNAALKVPQVDKYHDKKKMTCVQG